jgi:hypothetical protein
MRRDFGCAIVGVADNEIHRDDVRRTVIVLPGKDLFDSFGHGSLHESAEDLSRLLLEVLPDLLGSACAENLIARATKEGRAPVKEDPKVFEDQEWRSQHGQRAFPLCIEHCFPFVRMLTDPAPATTGANSAA